MWGNRQAAILRPLHRRFTPTRVGKSAGRPVVRPGAAVHPHACGEIGFAFAHNILQCGSPPRVWGNHDAHGRGDCRSRFTPTRVGKSHQSVTPADSSTVHPHACGEIWPAAPTSTLITGSPPRVWGNRVLRQQHLVGDRFTPTRVGKSMSGASSTSRRSVHPHACGEIGRPRSRCVRRRGSPPRVWGNPDSVRLVAGRKRFTPTRVGKSGLMSPMLFSNAVHPHACGEIASVMSSQARIVGSPPRVWGNRAAGTDPMAAPRFTPTRVGKSSVTIQSANTDSVHPHACGEISRIASSKASICGSPPRVWGNRARSPPRVRGQRFTPTRVGKSKLLTPAPTPEPVHPHACGEITFCLRRSAGCAGSPPRVWGNRCCAQNPGVDERFTPTRVGKS